MTPSPENPVEIESFECTKILITGRNIFNPKEIGDDHTSGTTYGVKCEALGYGRFRISGSATSDNQFSFSKHNYVPIKLKPGALHLRQEEPANPKAYVDFFDKDKKWITIIQVNGTNTGSDQTITKEQADKIKYAMPCLIRGTGSTVISGTIRPYMYQDGEDVYEPYFGKSQNLDITLRSLPDGTCDEYKDGKIIRRVGRIILDGSGDEDWVKQSDNNVIRYFVTVNGMKKMNVYYSSIICDRLRTLNNHTHYDTEIPSISGYADFQNNYPDQNWIYVLGLGNIENIRTWLQENPIEVLYPLAAPTEEMSFIPVLPSQHPYTQVYTDSPVDTDIEWEILTSSNNDAAIEDLIARVTALESEVLNNA